MEKRVRLVSLALVLALPLASCHSSGGRTVPTTSAEAQMSFGVKMAEHGLWSEAYFRFQQAQRLEGADQPRLINNLAVASEAMGKFDDALAYYKQALQLDPSNPDLKGNYDRFVSFYESFRAKAGDHTQAVPPSPGTNPNAHSGQPAHPPPTQPGENPPMGTEPPAVPPLVPEPAPTPPLAAANPGGASHA
jgi:tetratricopeptide repeat protein